MNRLAAALATGVGRLAGARAGGQGVRRALTTAARKAKPSSSPNGIQLEDSSFVNPRRTDPAGP